MTKVVNKYGDTLYQFGSLESASSAVGIYFNGLITAFFEVIGTRSWHCPCSDRSGFFANLKTVKQSSTISAYCCGKMIK